MTKGEALTILAGSPGDELGDTLLELAVTYWLETGASKDDILFLTEEVLDSSGGISDGTSEG